MVEWIRNSWGMVTSPAGIIDSLVGGVIRLALDRCGRSIFALGEDEMVRSRSVEDERLHYTFNPLPLKPSLQLLGRNSLEKPVQMRLVRGEIRGGFLGVPWKDPLQRETMVGADRIELEICFIRPTDEILTDQSLTETSVVENAEDRLDLLQAYRDIQEMVQEYLGMVRVEVDRLTVKMSSTLCLVLSGISRTNEEIRIDCTVIQVAKKVRFQCHALSYRPGDRHVQIKRLQFSSDLLTEIVSLIPGPFVRAVDRHQEEEDAPYPKVEMELLEIDDLRVEGLWLDQRGCVTSFRSGRVTHPTFDFYGFVLESRDGVWKSQDQLFLRVKDLRGVIEWAKALSSILQLLSSVIESPSQESSFTQDETSNRLKGLDLIVECEELRYHLTVGEIDRKGVTSVRLVCGEYCIRLERGAFDERVLTGIVVRKGKCQYVSCQTLGFQDNVVSFGGARTSQLIPLIEWITTVIDSVRAITQDEDLHTTSVTSPEPSSLALAFQDCEIIHPAPLDQVEFRFGISEARVLLGRKILQALRSEVYLCRRIELDKDGRRSKILSRHLLSAEFGESDETCLEIKTLSISLDPVLFDQINYLLGSLREAPEWDTSEIDDEGLRELQAALHRSTRSTIEELVDQESQIIRDSRVCRSGILHSAYLERLSQRIDDLQTTLVGLTPSSSGSRRVIIVSAQVLLFDELLTHDSQAPKTSFLRANLQGLQWSFAKKKYSAPESPAIRIQAEPRKPCSSWIECHHFSLDRLAVVDQSSKEIDWKYLLISDKDRVAAEITLEIHGDSMSVDLTLAPLRLSLREETMLRLMCFINNQSRMPRSEQPTMVKSFRLAPVTLTLSYYPLVADLLPSNTLLSLRNHQISLKEKAYSYLENFSQLATVLRSELLEELQPTNYCQFLPSIGITRPCAEPISQIVSLWNRYLSSDSNRRKLRALTRQLGRGIDLLSEFFQGRKFQDLMSFFTS